MKISTYSLVFTIFVLLVFGIVILTSASSVVSFEYFNNSTHYLKHQLFFGILPGVFIWFVLANFDYHRFKKYSFFLLIINILLLILVFFPSLGIAFGGAKRWVDFQLFSFQPSEILKLTFILYFSTWISERKIKERTLKYTFFPFVAIIGIITLLMVLQPDIGTLGVILVVAFGLYFIAGAPWIYLIGIVMAGAGLLAYLVKSAPYRLSRVATFLGISSDPQGVNYHINQALLAIGSGGLFGLGLGKSRQKYSYLPEVEGDSIFAIACEELGFLRILILLFLFLFLIYQGFKIAKKAPDDFGRFLAAGIMIWVAFQTFINIMAMLNLVPLTGLPLPFISYGGTALVVLMAGMGILTNIARKSL